MMFKRFRFLRTWGFVSVVIFLPVLMFPCFTFAQEYPTKTIELIAAWAPGGMAPILARLIAEEATKYLPKPTIVVHKPGAAGTVGAYYVAKSAPDGYTLLMGRPGHLASAPLIQKLDYSIQDFEIIAQIAMAPLTLAVKMDSPWKTLTDLVSYARKNPYIVTCANGGGTYSSIHLHTIRFEQIAGVRLTYVPFLGSTPAMTALAGGHTSLCSRFPGEGEPLIDAGKVRVLTAFDSKRCKFYPNVPTSKEEGHDMEAPSWSALMAPKGTPKTILIFWENMLKKISQDSSFIEKAEKLKMSIEFQNAENAKKIIYNDIRGFSKIVKELGLKPM